MTLENFIFTFIVLISFVVFGFSVRRLLGYLGIGKADNRFDQIHRRMIRVLKIALAQTKLMREPLAGLLHLSIFWGFVVLLVAVVEGLCEGISGHFSFQLLGDFYSVITFSQEVFCVLIILAIIISLWRRFITKVPRLQVDAHGARDAAMILVWICMIVGTLLLQNAGRISLGRYQTGLSYPVSSSLAVLFQDQSTAGIVERTSWWIHILLVLGFLNYLPHSKHLHILTSVPNVFLSNLRPTGILPALNFNDETVTKFGVTDVEDLTWKQLLDGMTCTECGRCDSVCPARLTGKSLSPRKIITDTRHRTMEKAPYLISGIDKVGAEAEPVLARTLAGSYITDEELWSCTSCMACMNECPVMIEHVTEIMDMRRSLVLNESRFPTELRATFENLERNYTPWAFSHSSRADWAAGLDVPTMAENPAAEILFWVGCAGAYDARYQKVAQAFVKILKHAGVNFAILGTEEKCTGDAARRMGNEYLAQMLMNENIATLNNYHIKKIVAICPHCFHSLKREYPAFGGNYEVIHHSDFIFNLVQSGKIRLSKNSASTVTYHDSCYLARYHDLIDSPRSVMASIPGLQLIEMNRSKDRGLCCGAGGGRMWMEETAGKRINIERTEEAMNTHAGTIGTACPFCLTMLSDGIKAKDAAESVQIRDIAELVWDAMEKSS